MSGFDSLILITSIKWIGIIRRRTNGSRRKMKKVKTIAVFGGVLCCIYAINAYIWNSQAANRVTCYLVNEEKVTSPNQKYTLTMEQQWCSNATSKKRVLLSDNENPNTGRIIYEDNSTSFRSGNTTFISSPLAIRWESQSEVHILADLTNRNTELEIYEEDLVIRFFDAASELSAVRF